MSRSFLPPFFAHPAMVGILLVTAALLHPAMALGGAGPLSLNPRIEVVADTVRVCDLFDAPLSGPLRRHAGTVVLKAPLPGREHRVPGPFLLRKIALLPRCATLDIQSPHRVRITRKGQTIEDSRLRPFIEAVAKKTWGKEVVLTRFRVMGRRTLPLGVLTIVPEAGRVRIRKNRLEVPLSLSVDGTPEGRLTLTATAHILTQVAVTTEAIGRNKTITRSQIALEERPISPGDPLIILDPARAVGRMTTRALSLGTPLTTRLLTTPALVRRGDGVRIQYTVGGLTISATGIAKASGGMGDFIQVKNSRSGKGITCRITGERRVEPFF